jgi:hypothetical protein
MRALLLFLLVTGPFVGLAMAATGAEPDPVRPLSSASRPLRPPAEVEFVEPGPPPLPPALPSTPWRDADWWLRAMAAWRAEQPPSFLAAPPAGEPPALLLARRGRAATLAADCRPDSALAARGRLWRLAASWLPPAVRPWLKARARAEAYHAIMVRQADLYHDTVFQEVLYTDPPALRDER